MIRVLVGLVRNTKNVMGSDNGIHCQYDESNIILRKRSDFNKGDIIYNGVRPKEERMKKS